MAILYRFGKAVYSIDVKHYSHDRHKPYDRHPCDYPG